MVYRMSTTISIRVSKDLKERMKKVKINWSDEIRRFIEDRISRYEFLNALKDVESKAKSRKVEFDSTKIIREDRDER